MTDIRTSRNRTRGGRVRLSPAKSDAPAVASPVDDLDIAAGLLALGLLALAWCRRTHPD